MAVTDEADATRLMIDVFSTSFELRRARLIGALLYYRLKLLAFSVTQEEAAMRLKLLPLREVETPGFSASHLAAAAYLNRVTDGDAPRPASVGAYYRLRLHVYYGQDMALIDAGQARRQRDALMSTAAAPRL